MGITSPFHLRGRPLLRKSLSGAPMWTLDRPSLNVDDRCASDRYHFQEEKAVYHIIYPSHRVVDHRSSTPYRRHDTPCCQRKKDDRSLDFLLALDQPRLMLRGNEGNSPRSDAESSVFCALKLSSSDPSAILPCLDFGVTAPLLAV